MRLADVGPMKVPDGMDDDTQKYIKPLLERIARGEIYSAESASREPRQSAIDV